MMREQLEALIAELDQSYISKLGGSELIDAYYGVGGDFSDWMTGNFDDDVDTGNTIGSYEVAVEVYGKLQEILLAEANKNLKGE